jgi:hypothetical protein
MEKPTPPPMRTMRGSSLGSAVETPESVERTRAWMEKSQTPVCPHCQNKLGFVCGMCTDCGYNYITKEFNFVKVYVTDLPARDRAYLVDKHRKATERKVR